MKGNIEFSSLYTNLLIWQVVVQKSRLGEEKSDERFMKLQ
jgi:hypothetical protein